MFLVTVARVCVCVYVRARLTCAQCFEHTWLKQDTNTMKAKKLSKERMKKYILRRKWQVNDNMAQQNTFYHQARRNIK